MHMKVKASIQLYLAFHFQAKIKKKKKYLRKNDNYKKL